MAIVLLEGDLLVLKNRSYDWQFPKNEAEKLIDLGYAELSDSKYSDPRYIQVTLLPNSALTIAETILHDGDIDDITTVEIIIPEAGMREPALYEDFRSEDCDYVRQVDFTVGF